jgi:hypothetical protein
MLFSSFMPRKKTKLLRQICTLYFFTAPYNNADGLLINFGSKSLDFKRVYNKRLVNPQTK